MSVGVGGTSVAVGVSVGREVGRGVLEGEGGSDVAVTAICGAPQLNSKMDRSARLTSRDKDFGNKVTPLWLRLRNDLRSIHPKMGIWSQGRLLTKDRDSVNTCTGTQAQP